MNQHTRTQGEDDRFGIFHSEDEGTGYSAATFWGLYETTRKGKKEIDEIQ
jgi:hypothetical protein